MKIYIKPWCPWCIDALEWLRVRKIPHEVIDVTLDSSAYSHMRKISGQSLTPTLEMPDGDVLPDFDTRQLELFLRQKGVIS
ncbi:MAG: glutathione S-transferase N-terminal domain-containing protein [Chthoniobacterales bacterium]|nr:glutathione S-transferase N-terminal domain-containing protein [Chthoniobacterales bacterium]